MSTESPECPSCSHTIECDLDLQASLSCQDGGYPVSLVGIRVYFPISLYCY